MNKLNSKLLTVFLILGIIFFMAVIYMFFTNEIISKNINNNRHTLSINNIRLIKNGFLDTALIQKRKPVGESMIIEEDVKNACRFLLINAVDSTTCVQSDLFNLKSAIAPQTIDFFNNFSIPQSTFGDKYKIVVSCNNQNLIVFPIDNFYTLLDLKHKKNDLTEKREIKLTSTDSKLTILVTFTVD